jgi:HNH endonuclease
MYLKGLLAHLHNTTIPSGKKIHVCHACHNAKCSNPNHLYWGTASENKIDANNFYGKTIWDHMVEKYGLEEAKRRQSRPKEHYSQAGKKGNEGKPKSPEQKEKISKAIKQKWLTKKTNNSNI